MTNPFFSALCPQAGLIGDGTAGALVKWLQDYSQALFPANAIEYWSCNEWSSHPLDLKRESLVSNTGAAQNCYTAAACWATQGQSEGRLIQVYLISPDRMLRRLAWVKTFDALEHAWQLAIAVHRALEEYLGGGQAPAIVDIFRALPRGRAADLLSAECTKEFKLCASLQEVKIASTAGKAYFSIQPQGPAASLSAHAYVADCRKVLNNLELKFTETLSAELRACHNN